MAITTKSVTDTCVEAKTASRQLALLDTATKNRAVLAIADALEASADQIIEANARDLEAGRESRLEAALMDRLMLDEQRLAGDRRRHAQDRRRSKTRSAA